MRYAGVTEIVWPCGCNQVGHSLLRGLVPLSVQELWWIPGDGSGYEKVAFLSRAVAVGAVIGVFGHVTKYEL